MKENYKCKQKQVEMCPWLWKWKWWLVANIYIRKQNASFEMNPIIPTQILIHRYLCKTFISHTKLKAKFVFKFNITLLVQWFGRSRLDRLPDSNNTREITHFHRGCKVTLHMNNERTRSRCRYYYVNLYMKLYFRRLTPVIDVTATTI